MSYLYHPPAVLEASSDQPCIYVAPDGDAKRAVKQLEALGYQVTIQPLLQAG